LYLFLINERTSSSLSSEGGAAAVLSKPSSAFTSCVVGGVPFETSSTVIGATPSAVFPSALSKSACSF